MSKLKSDNLGAKGENRFAEWCEDEGLICNKSLRDRAGWDYLVDFEHDEKSSELLDHRKQPLSCVVQVKSIYDSTSRIKVKLNMAERLAKEPKPSFFVIMKIDTENNFSSAHVIHVIDECLEAILKRLRYEESKYNKNSINKKHITFQATDSNRIDLSGAALKEAFVRHAGKDLQSHIAKKAKQISSLGYEMKAYDGQFTLTAPDVDTLMDIFLGEKKNVDLDGMEIFETRFGIRLPHLPYTPGKITIEPNPTDRCRVKFKNLKANYSTVLAGEVYIIPWPMGGRRRMMIKALSLKMAIDFSDNRANINIRQDAFPQEAPIATWIQLHMIRWMMQSCETIVEINPEKLGKKISINLNEINRGSTNKGESLLQAIERLRLIEKLQNLAGDNAQRIFLAKDIMDVDDHLKMLLSLLNGGNLLFTTRITPNGLNKMENKDVRFVNQIQIGSIALGYYGDAKMDLTVKGHATKISIKSLELKGAELLDNDARAFANFKQSISDEDKTRTIFSAEV